MVTTNRPIWLTAWIWLLFVWLNVKAGWWWVRWDGKTWLFLMTADSYHHGTLSYWWDCLSTNLEPIRPRN